MTELHFDVIVKLYNLPKTIVIDEDLHFIIYVWKTLWMK